LKGNQRTRYEVLGKTTCDEFLAMLGVIDYTFQSLHPDKIIIARGNGPS
jgi:hypothetical protein